MLSILRTREAHFSLHETINIQNYTIWAKNNFHDYTEVEEPYIHYVLLFGVGSLQPLLFAPFLWRAPMSKSTKAQACRQAQLMEHATYKCFGIKR